MTTRHVLTAVMATASCFLGYAGTAQACGGDLTGPVVAHGRSAEGQRWSQIACLAGRRQLIVDISLPGPGGTDGGGGMAVPFPSSRHSVFLDAPGTGLGNRANENLIDGVAWRSAVRVRLYFRTGPPRVTATVRAPARELRRFRYLRNLRFFAYFFSDPRGLPHRVCGIDVHGRQTGCDRVIGT